VITQLKPGLVTEVPEHPEAGVLYVSVEYATTLHLCACGCGHEIVLGISPNDWRICWDGQTVSVYPSVGSWSLPCRSHYFIRRNRIRWARSWSDEEIAYNRTNDAARRHPTDDSAILDPVSEIPRGADTFPVGVASPPSQAWAVVREQPQETTGLHTASLRD
jgi:Family of unknown function (DUF6527)